ncbi:MAG: hypothetical protein WBB23_18175 [Desulforhopalus sp.]
MHLADTRNNDEPYRLLGHIKRKHQRAGISGFMGNLVDGRKIIGGIVENISTGGFEFSNLPESFDAGKYTYVAVITGRERHYKVLVKPCWKKYNGKSDINIGFKILDAPWEWVELNLNRISEQGYKR